MVWRYDVSLPSEMFGTTSPGPGPMVAGGMIRIYPAVHRYFPASHVVFNILGSTRKDWI